MDECPSVLAHAGSKGVAHALVATREGQSVFLFKASLVQQVFRAVEVIVLRVGHIDAQLSGHGGIETPCAVVLGEYLYHAIGSIRAVERCGGSTWHIFYMVDVLHGDVADGA